MKETAIYIHIPFCDHKCVYCDFYSISNLSKSEQYLASLKKEIEYYSKIYSAGRKIVSIYFGGGTPSLMDPAYIADIVQAVKENFNVADDAEITLETNPGTVNKKKLQEFKLAGINRISIGIQSFNDKELRFLTRIHDSALAEKTVYAAYDAGIINISIDLIFNLPEQSKEIWSHSLERAIALPIKHISAYSLILEPGTILNKMVIDKKVRIQGDMIDAELYEYTIDFLDKHGFTQYEVSNFVKGDYECVHNNVYWHYKDYLGFGTSAHSFADKKRWWNLRGLTFYLNAVNELGHGKAGEELLTNGQMLQEYVMLALRNNGLYLDKLAASFGRDWLDVNEKELNKMANEGLLVWDAEKIRLTKKGYLLCDEILTKLK